MSRGEMKCKLRRFAFCILHFAFCISLVLLAGCYQKMGRQPSYEPLEPSAFFKDGMSARPRVAGTVARGEISTNPYFDTGMINGQPGDGFPMPVTAALMDRGEDRYNIYCAQCHGRLGDGNGMIPARGFRRPPSFHTEQLRAQKAGHLFDVITNGFGAMPPYRTMVPPSDRWAIVAYIRALQLAQGATLNDVPADKRARLSGARVSSPAQPTATTGGGH